MPMNDNIQEAKATLLRLLDEPGMLALKLIDTARQEGVSDMDAREALLSLMVADQLEMTPESVVRPYPG